MRTTSRFALCLIGAFALVGCNKTPTPTDGSTPTPSTSSTAPAMPSPPASAPSKP